jgi:hypothetical protein
MAKNSNSQAFKIKASKQHQAGTIIDQSYKTQYDQGFDAFSDGYALNKLWSAPKQAGWRKARNNEALFFSQTGSAASLARIQAADKIAA